MNKYYRASFCAAAMLSAALSSRAATTYKSTKIVIDTVNITVGGFNTSQQAVIERSSNPSAGSDGKPHLFNLSNGGQLGGQGDEVGPLPGFPKLDARGMNDTAQVVGAAKIPPADGEFPPVGTMHAYLYSDGHFADLSAFLTNGAQHSFAGAINNQGEVVGGWSTSGADSWHAFLYSHGAITEIRGPNGEQIDVTAADINDLGQIVGTYPESNFPMGSVTQSYIYDHGVATKIPVGYKNFASFINNRGEVGGFALTTSRDQRCYLYSNGQVTLLGPPATQSLLVTCDVRGLSNTGVMAGITHGPNAADNYPFVYSNGVMTDLNQLISADDALVRDKIRIADVVAVNGNGEMLVRAADNQYFLLTPMADSPTPTATPAPTPPTTTPAPAPTSAPTPQPAPTPTAAPTPPATTPAPTSAPPATTTTTPPASTASPPAAAASAPTPAPTSVAPAPTGSGGGGGALDGALLLLLATGVALRRRR